MRADPAEVLVALGAHPRTPDCVYGADWGDCPRPGEPALMSLFLLNLLFPKTKVRFVKGKGWSLTNRTEPTTDNVTVMGLVYNGLADFTSPSMTLAPRRMRLFRSFGPIYTTRHVVMYYQQPESAVWVYFAALGTGCVMFVADCLWQCHLDATERSSNRARFLRRFKPRATLAFGLFTTLFFRFFASDIVLIMNDLTPRAMRFPDMDAVVAALRRGETRAVTTYKALFDLLKNSSAFSGAADPPLLLEKVNGSEGTEDVMDYLMNKDKSHVFFSAEGDLALMRHNFCGIAHVVDYSSPPIYLTMYHRSHLGHQVSRRLPPKELITRRWQELRMRLFPPRRECPGLGGGGAVGAAVTLATVAFPVLLTVALAGASVAVALAEMFVSRLGKKVSQCFKSEIAYNAAAMGHSGSTAFLVNPHWSVKVQETSLDS